MKKTIQWIITGVMMGLCFCTVLGAATYSVSDGVLTVNVDAEGATLDATQVTADITNIVKIGSGVVTSTPLQSYTGDITLNEGVFLVTNKYHFGADNVGTVYVNDGASIADASVFKTPSGGNDWSSSAYVAQNKTFVFSGEPAAGHSAKFYRPVGGSGWFGRDSMFRFLTDSTIDYSNQRIKLKGIIDLGGNTLTIENENHSQVQVACMVTNGGTVFVRGAQVKKDPSYATFHNEGGTFGFYPSEVPNVLTVTNSNFKILGPCIANGATLNIIDSEVNVGKHSLRTDLSTYRWDGPLNILGTSGLVRAMNVTNVLNIAGNIDGSGSLTIGPGWLNIMNSQMNTYSGDVTVVADTTGVIAPEHSGVALLDDDSQFFPTAQSVTFKDGANLSLSSSYSQPLPKLTFAGVGESAITGGPLPIESTQRVTLGGLEKTDNGTLQLDSLIHVVGTASVMGGTLKLPSKVYGHAGLWEWTHTGGIGYRDDGVTLTQLTWGNTWEGDAEKVNMTTNQEDAVYSRMGPVKYLTGYTNIYAYADCIPGITEQATAVTYKGYLWNRTDEPATWQLAMHHTYRGRIWLNGSWLLRADGSTETQVGTNVYTVVLQPGPNPVFFYTMSARWLHGQQVSPRFDGLGFSYDPNPVEGQTNVANFVKLDDGGSGRLFTIDAEDSLEAIADMLPMFDNLAFAPDTVFDLNGNTFLQGNLSGFPRVENGDLTITNTWSLSTADVLAGKKLVATGTLAFADGTMITSADESVSNTQGVQEILIAEAARVVGKPTVDADAPALRNWKVRTTNTTVTLAYVAPGTVFIVR